MKVVVYSDEKRCCVGDLGTLEDTIHITCRLPPHRGKSGPYASNRPTPGVSDEPHRSASPRDVGVQGAVGIVAHVPQILGKSQDGSDLIERSDDLRLFASHAALQGVERDVLELPSNGFPRQRGQRPSRAKDLE